MDKVFDVAIIGGGINGCGCAADASLRGLSVVLFEKDDLASKTSSSSTKLIHGGLRYLEHYDFSLVKKALDERQNLLNLAPHLVKPQPFVLPYSKHMRPAWFLRLGLFIYDYLSRKNKLPKCRSIRRSAKNRWFDPLVNMLTRGFIFYDASTDDSRLTLCNALQAKNNGASIRTRSIVIKTEVVDGLWQISVQPESGLAYTVLAKSLINASGPWVKSIARMTQITAEPMTLVKGSHFVVPKMYEGNQAYFLQHEDKRVVFVIPYYGYTMIGTTDVLFSGSPDKVEISNEEIDYLISLVNSYFKIPIHKQDIITTWSGVRPLLTEPGKDAKSLSRDYHFDLEHKPAPIVTVYGGKITTYRQLAEELIDQLKGVFPDLKPSITHSTPLPGAVLGSLTLDDYAEYARKQYAWLPHELLERYLNSYGTCTEIFLSQCTSISSMGKQFSTNLYQVEVDYLVLEEWAHDCDDVLNRRTKLGLNFDAASREELAAYLANITTYPVEVDPVFH